MKTLKYIAGVFAAGLLMASCSDRDVEFKAEEVDPVHSGGVAYELHYFAPVKNVADNYIHKIKFGDKVYENKGGAMLNPYNGTPGGSTYRWYFLDKPGTYEIVLYDKKDNVVYSNVVDLSQFGSKYCNIFVYDLTKAPIVHDAGTVPTGWDPSFTSTDTGTHCSIKFYNFLYEDPTTPVSDKIQLVWRNRDTREYETIEGCTPVAFGECTEWFRPEVIKEQFNSSGSEARYIGLRRIDPATGADKGFLQFNSNGKIRDYKDYSRTLAIGRAYRYILGGCTTLASPSVTCPTWYAY